jgi:hypothetical protein
MKIIINEHQYKFILSEFMGTVDTDKFIPILEKFLEEKGVFIVFIDKTEKNEIFLDVKITNLNVSSFSEILEFLKIYNWFISYYEINYKEDNEYNSKNSKMCDILIPLLPHKNYMFVVCSSI